jgi:hypothetical protein
MHGTSCAFHAVTAGEVPAASAEKGRVLAKHKQRKK